MATDRLLLLTLCLICYLLDGLSIGGASAGHNRLLDFAQVACIRDLCSQQKQIESGSENEIEFEIERESHPKECPTAECKSDCEGDGISRFYECLSNRYSVASYKVSFEMQARGQGQKDNICIVSYSTSSILPYAAYSFAINGIFSFLNNYRLFWTDDKAGYNHDINDQRWNKVKIVWDFLEDPSLAPFCEYVVWADSDLIFMNFLDFDLRSFINEYPRANFIASRDPTIENGIINSGCFLVKRSEWSKTFFKSWWNLYDRKHGMDQHVFDKLWVIKSLDCSANIVLLPPNAINSHIPAWIHQQSSDSVLHLAGAPDLYRKAVFKRGFAAACSYFETYICRSELRSDTGDDLGICSTNNFNFIDPSSGNDTTAAAVSLDSRGAVRQDDDIKKDNYNYSNYTQLGLSKDVLIELHNTLPLSEQIDMINASLHEMYSNIKQVQLADILKLKYKFRNLLQSGYGGSDVRNNTKDQQMAAQGRIKDTLLMVYRTLQLKYETFITAEDSLSSSYIPSATSTNAPSGGYERVYRMKLDLLQQLVDSAFNLVAFNYIDMDLDCCVFFIDLLVVLEAHVDHMANLAPSSNRGVALYYKFKLNEFVANLYLYGGILSSNISMDERRDKSETVTALEYFKDYGFFHLDYLSKSLSVWESLENLNHFGSGNNVADPYKEVVVILSQYADGISHFGWRSVRSVGRIRTDDVISEAEKSKPMTSKDAIYRALNYLDRIWRPSIDVSSRLCINKGDGKHVYGGKEGLMHTIPDYVFNSYFTLMSSLQDYEDDEDDNEDNNNNNNNMKKNDCMAFYEAVSCILPLNFASEALSLFPSSSSPSEVLCTGRAQKRADAAVVASNSNPLQKKYKQVVFRRRKSK